MNNNDINIEGLVLIENFVSETEENYLIEEVNKMPWLKELQRRVQHYGFKYDYKSKSIKKEDFIGKIPQFCDFVVKRIMDKDYMSKEPDKLIVNEYTPGQGISPHIDSVELFEDEILSISLGSDITMNFTEASDKTNIKSLILKRRTLMCLSKDARYKWKHSIPQRIYDIIKGKKVKRDTRISLTFRKVKQN